MTAPDPDNPTTVGGHIRKFLADLRLARQVQADFSDQEAINRDYERAIAAEDAAAAHAWEQMRADGVPVAQPETGRGIPPAYVPDPAPQVEAGAEPEIEAEP